MHHPTDRIALAGKRNSSMGPRVQLGLTNLSMVFRASDWHVFCEVVAAVTCPRGCVRFMVSLFSVVH